MTYIKENNSDFTGFCPTNVKRPILKLQKLYSLPRNLTAGNKSPAPFLRKPLCLDDLSPMRKIFIETPDSAKRLILHAWKKSSSQVITKNGSRPMRLQYSLIVNISLID